MGEGACDIIVHGRYIIIQRKDYKKLHLLSEKNCVFIGKDKVELCELLGKKIGSTFKMIPKKGLNRHFTLQLCSISDISSAKESFKELGSGLDNRSISDDGSSQLLTSDLIEELRDSGTTPKAIITQLIENSKTFQIKTEYSQEKYIKKKEKKYFEFITIRNPSIRLIAEVLYNRDVPKSIGMRLDTLSQLITGLNFQPDGRYLLVENGFNGLVAATLLNSLSEEGRLVHITPGTQNQKQAILAMNFSCSHLARLMTVRLSTIIEMLEKNPLGGQDNSVGLPSTNFDNSDASCEINGEAVACLHESRNDCSTLDVCPNEIHVQKHEPSLSEIRKRKYSNLESQSPEIGLKKPRWAMTAELAVDILLKKVDGLVIACKEFASDIFDQLFVYVMPSRPFVIYSLYHEPLVQLYLHLKQRHDVICLRITETWLRPYQVLPERSHPAVTVSSSSGFLLSGIKVLSR